MDWDDLPSSITPNVTEGHVGHSVKYKGLLRSLRFTVSPSGDVSGATDWANIDAAITAAAAVHGTVVLVAGTYYIDNELVVVEGVDLVGANGSLLAAGTLIVCTASGAGVSFGTRTDGGRGGTSGGFVVDGDDVATRPLYFGLTVLRRFRDITSYQSAGHGLVAENTQNSMFENVHVSHAALNGHELLNGVQSCHWRGGGIDTVGDWYVHYTVDGSTPPPDAGTFPYLNSHGFQIMERGAVAGGFWQEHGSGNGAIGVNLVNATLGASGFRYVQIDEGLWTWTDAPGGQIQSAEGGKGYGFTVASGADLNIIGEPTMAALDYIYDLNVNARARGRVYDLSCNHKSTNGVLPVDQVDIGSAILDTQEFWHGDYSLTNASLGGSVIPITADGGTWVFDPDDYDIPDGRKLQIRFTAKSYGMFTSGSQLGILGYDSTNSAAVGVEEIKTVAAATADYLYVIGPWVDAPASAAVGVLWARNPVRTEGKCNFASMQVRYV